MSGISLTKDAALASLKRNLKPMMIFMVASNILLLAVPLFMAQVYDRVLSSRSYETLGYLTLLTIIALLVYAAVESVRGVLAQRVASQFMTSTANDVMTYLLNSNVPEGQRNMVMRDLTQMGSFVSGRAAMGLLDLPFAPVFVFLLFFVHWGLALLALAAMIALGAVTWLNNKFSKAAEKKSSDMANESLQQAAIAFQRDEDVRAMGMQSAMLKRWGNAMAGALNAADNAVGISSPLYGFGKFVRQLVQIAQLGVGAILVLQGEMSGGLIFVASILGGRALQPIEQTLGAWPGLMQAQTAWNRISEVIENSRAEPERIDLPAVRGYISVEGLSYTADADPNARPILTNVNFALQPGEIAALIGPSGAGKSTVARIIAGSLVGNSGKVRLDNFDYALWKPEVRGAAIGYVSQDIALFPGTIAENIARMSDTPNDEMVVRSAQLAGVHELVASLPEGYGTKLGVGGIRLSGGQRQRIALARAFYGNPRVLVLDEPNSNLDPTGEQLLAEALQRAKASGLTILLVSQRQSILSIVDRVILMENGTVARIMVPSVNVPQQQHRTHVVQPAAAQMAQPHQHQAYASAGADNITKLAVGSL